MADLRASKVALAHNAQPSALFDSLREQLGKDDLLGEKFGTNNDAIPPPGTTGRQQEKYGNGKKAEPAQSSHLPATFDPAEAEVCRNSQNGRGNSSRKDNGIVDHSHAAKNKGPKSPRANGRRNRGDAD